MGADMVGDVQGQLVYLCGEIIKANSRIAELELSKGRAAAGLMGHESRIADIEYRLGVVYVESVRPLDLCEEEAEKGASDVAGE